MHFGDGMQFRANVCLLEHLHTAPGEDGGGVKLPLLHFTGKTLIEAAKKIIVIQIASSVFKCTLQCCVEWFWGTIT